MALIELGELRGEPLDAPTSRRPAPPVGRPVRIGLLLLLLLVTMTGADPAAEPPVGVTVPARLGAEAVVADGRLYVIDPETVRNAGTERQIAAFALPAGTLLWRVPLPPSGWVSSVHVGDGRLLVSRAPAEGFSDETLAFDIADGRTLWRQAGRVTPTERGGLLLRVRTPPTDPGPSGDPVHPTDPTDRYGTLLRAVDPASGAERWSRSFDAPEWRLAFAGRSGRAGVSRLVSLTTSGRAEVRDPDSGGLLHSVDLHPADRTLPRRTVQVAGDLLLVGSGRRVDAYGLDRLEHRWQNDGLRPGEVYLFECGEALCHQSGDGMTVLDPSTGQVRWRDSKLILLRVAAGRLLVTGGGRPGAREPLTVLDLADGKPLARLGPWELALRSEPDDPLIGTHPRADGRLTVAELDLVAGRAVPGQVLPGVALPAQCQTGGQVLICRRTEDGLGIWRLDR